MDLSRKYNELKESKINLYPEEAVEHRGIKDVISNFKKLGKTKKIPIAGRIMALRSHGDLVFSDIKDCDGKIQILFRQNELRKKFDVVKNLDLGDIVWVEGSPFETKTKEKTLLARNFRLLTKVLIPLQKEYYAPEDIELRLRRRYLDLIYNDDLKKSFVARSRIIKNLRDILWNKGFLEVETPILQPTYGGALAQPFKTQMEALNLPLYLRIAPELYLKRLLVAGFEKIFEIGKNFRNEGIDREHNPEFTMMELYYAYQDRNGLMEFITKIFKKLIRETIGGLKIGYQEKRIDFSKPFKKYDFTKLLKQKVGLDYFKDSEAGFMQTLRKYKITFEAKVFSRGKIADELFKKVIRPTLWQPTFILNHPVELSPLAKLDPRNDKVTKRFQLICAGMEIVNGFSELNDSVEQRRRFEKQQQLLAKGDVESHPFDQDFIEALEYGMPPAAGLGLGIDRLVMILTNQKTIRDVILFPLLRRGL